MKKLFILTLCFLGCFMLITQSAFSQADDGACTPATTVNPITPTPDPPPATACSDGTNVPTFGTASGSLPNADFVVELNGVIDDINATGVPLTTPVDGDVVCVTAFTYDLAAINALLNQAAGLCPILNCDATFGIPGINQAIADLVSGANDGTPGLNSLQEALDFAGSFGAPATDVVSAVALLDGLNAQIGGLLGNICYATSAPVCYTIDDTDPACAVAAACTVDAGEPTPTTAEVCDTDLAAVDVTAIFADPEVAGTPSLNQNYVIVDPTNANDIISVSNTAVLDLTGLDVGDQACVVSVAYTQETLDIVTAFLDAQLSNICVPITGPCASDFLGPFGTLDLSGVLNGLNGALEGFGFNFTSDDIALWCVNQEITIPLSALPGGLLPDLVIDLTTIPGLEPDGFCCDFSTDSYCLTVIDCMMTACEADAPTMSIVCADCDDGTFGAPCMVNDAGDGSANAGEITEYLVIDDAAGTATGTPDGVISVGPLADAQAAVDGLADGDEVCVTAITHIQTELDVIIAEIEAAIAPLGFSLGLPAAGNTLADVYTAIQGLTGGATVDLATIETLIGNGAGGTVDLGAAIGLPPGVLTVDISPFCYNVDPPVCVTGATCGVASACTVDAGEPTPTTADVCDTDLAAVDVTAVFADPGVPGTPSLNQNYVIVDPTNANDIISVSNTAVLDLTGLAVGDQACVTSVAYTQETLDIVTEFLDAQLASICVPVIGTPCASDFIGPFGTLDLSGFLNGLNGAFELVGFNFTSDDIALWCINQEITIPLSALGVGLDDFVVDLTTIPGLEPDGFCCDFSTDSYCITVISCEACNPAISTITADPAVIASESTCDMATMTLTGGVIDPPATACPDGSTLEYSTDAGATWSATLPTYDQTTAITVDTRCVCDSDPDDISMIGTVTTTPGSCMGDDVTLEITDPCNCDLGEDLDGNPANGNELAQETITIIPGMAPFTTTSITGLLDAAGNPLSSADVDALIMGPDGAGNYTITAYVMADGSMPYTLDIQDANTSTASITGGQSDCGCAIMVDCEIVLEIGYICDDMGDDDLSNDVLGSVEVLIMANNPGASGMWQLCDENEPPNIIATGAYGDLIMIDVLPADLENDVYIVKDMDNPACLHEITFDYDCTLQIPTLSQWGLITLALLLMVMGSLKMGFNSISFQRARKK